MSVNFSFPQFTPKKKIIVLVFGLLILILFIGGLFSLRFFSQKKGDSSVYLENYDAAKKSAKDLTTSKTLTGDIPQFAEFKEEKVEIKPAVPSYSLKKEDLVNLTNIEKAIKSNLNPGEIEALENTGFFIKPAENKLAKGEEEIDFRHGELVDEFLLHYRDIGGKTAAEDRLPENTVFITSDFLLHVFHVYLDRTFQSIEESKFHPKLKSLSDTLFEKSLAEYGKATDESLKASFSRLTTFFLIPKVILEASIPIEAQEHSPNPAEEEKLAQSDNEVDTAEKIMAKLESYKTKLPEPVYQKAKEELALISKGEGAALSPLYGEFRQNQPDDYTQFKPRSHYQKNSRLRSYFKAMIWYGRNGFLVKSDELTLDALIQTKLLTENSDALTSWENIYLPTVFFVGKSDDLTIYDHSKLIKKVYGEKANFADLTNKEKLDQVRSEIKKLPGPKIQSSIVMVGQDTTKEEALLATKSFRFMGQRFIPDSFIFSTLTQGDEAPDKETGQKLPAIPTALMPLSVFGSKRADFYLNKWITKNAQDSDKVIAKEKKKLGDEFSKLTLSDWTQNLYWSWLYTLKSLFQEFTQGYPSFMQSTAWNDKDLTTALGSYTELRHDTLLYAKQSYAELGGGGPRPTPPPVPKGYVEPNLVFFNRLIALSKMTKDGLTNNQVLVEEQGRKLDQFITSLTFFKKIAEQELQNQTISDDDFEKLRNEAVRLNEVMTPPSYSETFMKAKEARAGLIADVHTAVTLTKKEILYEATGIPYIIYVAVKDANGARLTRGVTYSYYEFIRPYGERLSDSDWQTNIYEGKNTFPLPDKPEWVKNLEK